MDERRKIVIPIGGDADAPSDQTFFDTQSRKDARPVVPLPAGSTSGPGASGTPSRKVVILVVAVVAFLAAAGTAVVYAYMSRDRAPSGPQAAVQPVAGKTLSTLPWTHTPEDPAAEVNPDSTEQATAAKADNAQDQNDRAANDGGPTKVVQPKKKGKTARKDPNEDPDNPVKRTKDELHRIRDIFEGPP